MFNLTDKVALVVGGAGYLSLPACKGLAEHGAAVVVVDLTNERVEQALAEIRAATPEARLLGLTLNINDEPAVQAAIARVMDEFGRLDILVNAAYHTVAKLPEDIPIAEFRNSLGDHLGGTLILVREAGKVMTAGASIILFASMYGQVAPDPRVYIPPMQPNPLVYGIAKAGIIQMAKYFAAYWGKRGIRVNAIAPGAFPFPQTCEDDPGFCHRLAMRAPLERIGRRDEIAGTVLYLASDDASFVTGETIAVNGGWTAW